MFKMDLWIWKRLKVVSPLPVSLCGTKPLEDKDTADKKTEKQVCDTYTIQIT